MLVLRCPSSDLNQWTRLRGSRDGPSSGCAQLSITAVFAHRTARLSPELLSRGPSITCGASWSRATDVSSPGKTTWGCQTKWKRFYKAQTPRPRRPSPKVRSPNTVWCAGLRCHFQAVEWSRSLLHPGKLHSWAFWSTGIPRTRRCPHQVPQLRA